MHPTTKMARENNSTFSREKQNTKSFADHLQLGGGQVDHFGVDDFFAIEFVLGPEQEFKQIGYFGNGVSVFGGEDGSVQLGGDLLALARMQQIAKRTTVRTLERQQRQTSLQLR